MLFFTKVGMYTSEEFDKALEQFKQANKPLIYTYFKDTLTKIAKIPREDMKSLWAFQDKLKNLGHFQIEYETAADLKLHFKEQLDKLFAEEILKKGKISLANNHIRRCLAAGQPSVPPEFIGRDIELADIKEKLEKNNLLLINAEGGMGKTTLAAKYLTDNIENYKHYAWLFCDNGITEQIKTLATPLNVDLTKYLDEDAQLLAIKTAMQNLHKDGLLILDNANEPEHIDNFQKHFSGLQWHVLLTSRCQQVMSKENEYTLNHLKPENARILFKNYHDEQTPEFEMLLDKFLAAIGYNTLMIELFSKNLHELSAVGETLANMLEAFEEKGLFLNERSFEIKTSWTGHVHKKAATTDEVIEILYDFRELEEADRKLLVNLALLPAEGYALTLLIDALTPEDKIAFARQIKALAQKGWVSSDTKSCRMSPVVQQIVIAKNKDTLTEDATILISNLSGKLESDGGVSLINLKSYTEAQPFTELANSVNISLKDETFEIGLSLVYLSDYYKAIGNFKSSLEKVIRAAEIFQKVDKENFSVCLGRLGDIYQQQGDFKKALQFFEQRAQLTNELFEVNPHSESLKNWLAISYSNLGEIYKQQGDFKKAHQLFEQCNNLCEELFEANLHSESTKNGLAVSYENLGDIYQQQGDFKKALHFFEQRSQLGKELFEENPHSESLKNGLAISYSKLGEIYKQQGDFKKALQFFEQYNDLCKELSEANPDSESLKNGLAISWSNLGDIYQKQGDFKKALQFVEQYNELKKQLFEANPHSVSLHNGLAISLAMLGHIYLKIGEREKTKEFYLQAEVMWLHLNKTSPEVIDFKERLEWVKNELASL